MRKVLLEAGLQPAPQRTKSSWRAFLRAQAASMLACDFLTVDTLFFMRFFILFVIELASRRVQLAGVTANPDCAWVTQQGGSTRGGVKDRPGPGWSEVWEPLQPTAAERRMEPRVVAATEREVVVHWHQRGLSPSGERFDGEALGLYEVRDGKFARAQMFYFDALAVQRFLAAAGVEAGHSSAEAAGATGARDLQ